MANKHFWGIKPNQPSLVYLSFSSRALLHRTPGKGSTRSEGLEGRSKDIADPKSYQLLQPGQRETITCYHDPQRCTVAITCCAVAYLISIDGVVVFYRIDLRHREGDSEPHYGHGKCIHCRFLENLQAWSHGWLVPKSGN